MTFTIPSYCCFDHIISDRTSLLSLPLASISDLGIDGGPNAFSVGMSIFAFHSVHSFYYIAFQQDHNTFFRRKIQNDRMGSLAARKVQNV